MKQEIRQILEEIDDMGVELTCLSSNAHMISTLWEGDTDRPSKQIICESFMMYGLNLSRISDCLEDATSRIYHAMREESARHE